MIKRDIVALAALMGLFSGESFGQEPERKEIDVTKHKLPIADKKVWVVNGNLVDAVTKKQAIKKAKKQNPESFKNRMLTIYQL